MENEKMITIETFCRYHQVEENFVFSIQEAGLIEFQYLESTSFIAEENIAQLEKIVRLHRELDINPEGIGAILELLQRIDFLQRDNQTLRNKLKWFEE